MSKLSEALQTGDIKTIKSSTIAYLSADPLDKSGEIKKAIATIDGQGINIWQPHDEDTVLYTEPSKWTKSYFAELQAHLVTNFSKSCLELALKVGRHAYREELNRPTQQEKPRMNTNQTHQTHQTGGNDQLGKILMAGAAVIVAGIAIYLIAK